MLRSIGKQSGECIRVASCYRCSIVCLYVSVTSVSCAELAGLIKMLFGIRTQVGPVNHILDGGLDPPGVKEG